MKRSLARILALGLMLCLFAGCSAKLDDETLARIDGITPVEPKVGEVLNAGDADAPKVTYLAAILGQLLTRDMASKVTVIDLSDAASPSFLYDGRFTVRLGANENVEYKFGMLQSAVSQLTASDAGTIDLSIDKRAHFSPG